MIDHDDGDLVHQLLEQRYRGELPPPQGIRPSSSLGSMGQLQRRFSEAPKSCWECESATPMTTRPHFTPIIDPSRTTPDLVFPLSEAFQAVSAARRTRSNSVGAKIETRRCNALEQSLVRPTIQGMLAANGRSRLRNDEDATPIITNAKSSLSQLGTIGTPSEGGVAAGDAAVSILPANATTTVSQPRTQTTATTPWLICVLYGMINATMVIPVLMSFASIIYQHDAFQPYMPVLVRLTIFSGIVHQLCFSTFSSLPFAVGSVQDAGLIFLSSMTAFIVDYCHSQEYPDDTILATATVGLGIGTAVLGCGLILIGYCQLAQYVQMLPTCVVGGYLAYIGWFCGLSGVRLMAGGSNLHLMAIFNQWRLVLPGLLSGLAIYTAIRRLRHMAVLPTCSVALILIFYLALWATDTSVAQATDYGWIRAMDPPPVWYKTWDYIRLDKVQWDILPNLLLTEFGMILVVALSSSLDVAAIELEVKRPLNYNRELRMVGMSNLMSGLTGGYTGSYIFSQTIFSLRAGIQSRVAGYALAGCQIIVILLPFPILSYVPNFFFGSLLLVICFDLMYEWLWDVRKRITPIEFCLALSTFGMIQAMGVEYGIVGGVLAYLLCYRLRLDVGESKFRVTETSVVIPKTTSVEDESLHGSESKNGNGHPTFPSYGSLP